MTKPAFVATGLIALSTQLGLTLCPLSALASPDNALSQHTKAKPDKMPTDKQLKKGSKTEKREKADDKKDSMSPANGNGTPPAF
jgi:hypothetical protein